MFYDRCDAGWKEGPILYHHSDGYPDAMLPKLERLFWMAMEALEKQHYGVDAEEVAAIMVAGSVRSTDVPAFYPSRRTHDDIEYKYHVYVDGKRGEIQARDRNGHIVGTVVIDEGGVGWVPRGM
jgi:hypothetical protein